MNMSIIRRSPVYKTPRRLIRSGFTLVEIMVCVGIFALLCSLALPGIQSYLVRSRGSTCANNLQIIEASKKAWAFDHSGQVMPADPLAAGGLADYLPGRTVPRCPAGGTYNDVTTLGTRCACSANTTFTASTRAAQPSRSDNDPDIGGPDWLTTAITTSDQNENLSPHRSSALLGRWPRGAAPGRWAAAPGWRRANVAFGAHACAGG